jgi:Tfp pilus assembly PilM family ATPase
MIREELAAEFPDEEPCFDYWETTPQSRGETASLAVTMLPAPRAQKIARLIAAQRLDCHVIDSGLCALARATRESVPRCSGEEATTLAVDLGWTSTRLLLTQRGEPRFCRVLPDSGCRHWVQRLVERFQLRGKEAWSVLEQLGVGSTESSKRLGPAGEIRVCLEPVLLQLTHELQRTMQFVRRQLPDQLPTSVWLFGGGARIRCIETKLAEHLQLPTACWQASASTSSRTDARASSFATARALSALAWEEQ